MSTILVTGSTQGIGLETAAVLAAGGHRVVLHARDEQRAGDARAALPAVSDVLVGDLGSLDQTRRLAADAAEFGRFDAVVHNAGIGGGVDQRTETTDGFELIFQVNVIAPYLLTALMPPPHRLVYLTSGLQDRGTARWDDLQFVKRRWNGMQAYSDSKLFDLMLAFAVARLWPGTVCNAVDPGWIRTRMGGPAATDDLSQGADTPAWLAAGTDAEARLTGRYLKHRIVHTANPLAVEQTQQQRLLDELAALTGVRFPA